MEVIVQEDEWIEGCVFQRDKRERMGIQYLEEEFQEGLR